MSPVLQRFGHDRDGGAAVAVPDDLRSPGRSMPTSAPMNADSFAVDSTAPPGIEPFAAAGVDAFAIQIHRSLNPREVVAFAVQELRPILRCDRVSILERRGRRFRLVAVSGQPGKPPHSRQASLLEQFVTAVLSRGERFQFPDENLTLPDDLGRKLADYWENANGQMILVEPLYSEIPGPADGTPQTEPTGRVIGALVIEQFNRPTLPPGAVESLESAVKHLTPALANARKYSRLVSVPGLYQLGLISELIRRSRTVAVLTSVMILAGFLVAACLIERPFEIDCHGRLMPTVRREVFAGLEGEIVEVTVHESEHVEAGQIVARMQSRELEKLILQQTGLLNGKLKARDAARAELHGRSTPQVRGQSSRDQAQLGVINAEIDTIHRQLELLEREQRELVIRAPIAGTITTERPREKLFGRPVHRGEALLEIMDESGGWQLELTVAERKIGHLLTHRQQHPRRNPGRRACGAGRHDQGRRNAGRCVLSLVRGLGAAAAGRARRRRTLAGAARRRPCARAAARTSQFRGRAALKRAVRHATVRLGSRCPQRPVSPPRPPTLRSPPLPPAR